MSEAIRENYIAPSAEAAQDAIDSFLGGPLQVKSGEKKYLFFMPAYTVRDGRGIWFSVANRHYGVPLTKGQGEERELWTYDCPQSIGARCITCENKKLFQDLGVWGGNNKRGCKPSRRVRFNVIDAQNASRGVVVFEDGVTTLKMIRTLLRDDPNIMDPFKGSVVIVENLGEDPWRWIRKADGGSLSIDELHPDAFDWALPENLTDLDKSWNFPTYEEQVAKFTGIDPSKRALPVGEQAALPPANDESEVIEAEVVEKQEEPQEEKKSARPWETDTTEDVQPETKPTGSGGSSLLDAFKAEIEKSSESD